MMDIIKMSLSIQQLNIKKKSLLQFSAVFFLIETNIAIFVALGIKKNIIQEFRYNFQLKCTEQTFITENGSGICNLGAQRAELAPFPLCLKLRKAFQVFTSFHVAINTDIL